VLVSKQNRFTFYQAGTESSRAQSPSATIFSRKLFMPRTYQHLQLEERALIQTVLEQGYKPAAIALSLGR
jgi:hypothetical protein